MNDSQKKWIVPVVVGALSFGSGLAVGYFLAKRTDRDPDLKETADEEVGIVIDPELDWWHDARKEEEAAKQSLLDREDQYQRDKAAWMAAKDHHPSSQFSREVMEDISTRHPVPPPVEEPDVVEYIEEAQELERDGQVEGVDYILVDPPVPRDPRPDPSDIVVDEELLAKINHISTYRDVVPEDYLKHDRFATSTPEWDMEEELANREANGDKPYVIHRDEFWGEESGFDQTTLTYYGVDDILVDEDDTPIYDYTRIVGPLLWGHGSGDPNVFHVRNPKLKSEFEILNHEDESYSKEILGIEYEVEDVKPTRHPRKKIRPPKE